jgi:hypothetical protein
MKKEEKERGRLGEKRRRRKRRRMIYSEERSESRYGTVRYGN